MTDERTATADDQIGSPSRALLVALTRASASCAARTAAAGASTT